MRAAAVLVLLVAALTGCSPSGVEVLPAAELETAPASPSPSQARTSAPATPTPPPATPTLTATPTPSPLAQISCEWAAVVSVTDGDTLVVRPEGGGAEESVRLIGIDAPEGAQALGPEAGEALRQLATGRVCLETDTTDRDRLGRLLRYAWREDGTLINESLVAAGLALVVTFPPDTRYLESRYRPAEAAARAGGLGLWQAAPTQAPQGIGGGVSQDGCDPAYPDFCIPPPSVAGDLDCGDVVGKKFRVLPPDPHGFDRDGDGEGCES